MKQIFKRIVRTGVDQHTPEYPRDEIKVINSIKVQSLLLIWLTAISTVFFLPSHAVILSGLMFIHLAVAVVVIRLNAAKHYSLAKWIFVMYPSILVLGLCANFGMDSNFQYIILICFLMFIYLFRRRSTETFQMLSTYIVFSLAGVLVLYTFDVQHAALAPFEVEILRVAVYSFGAALTIMMGIVLQRSARSRTRRTQETLKLSERDAKILQTISDNMEEAIFRSSLTEGLEFINDTFVRMYGYDSKEEMLGTHPVNLYYSRSDRDTLLSMINKNGKVANMLVRYRRKDGSTFWGRLTSSRIVEDEKEYLVGTITDVTQQQERTEMLKISERQLREAQRLAKVGNWQAFPDRGAMEWSGECASIHGFLPMDYEDSLKVWVNGFQDMSFEALKASIQRAHLMNKPLEFGTWYKTDEGSMKYLYYICQVGESEGKKVWSGTVQDRTELKNQELELISTREFYQNVLDNIPVEAILVDAQANYSYISKNAIGDTDLRRFMIGKKNEAYAEYRGLPKEFAQLRDAKFKEALEGDLTIRWEEKMKTPDGRDSYHIRNLVPVELIQGRARRKFLIGYSFNINDIKRAQFRLEDRNEELNQLNKELDRFVYSISHDLRAPIASVLGLNSLAEEAEDTEELNNILLLQREALDRLDRYIRDVIDYSRNKRLDVRAEEVKVREVVDDCMNDLVYMSNYEDIDYYIEVEDGLSLRTDSLRMRIIINNLLSNAIKYSDPKKDKRFIAVRANMKGKGIVLEIEDNGIGIKDEHQEQIWDIFFRGTSTVPGSGLGLYILRESTRNIGGKVSYETKEGKGTTFTVNIPGMEADPN